MVCKTAQCQRQAFNKISNAAPSTFFRASRFPGDPLSFSFKNLSTVAVSQEWDFGDDTELSYRFDKHIPQHTYFVSPDEGEDGYFTVTLTITRGDGSIETYSQIVNALVITAGFTSIVDGLDVLFTDTTQAEFPVKLKWQFGDGFESTAQNPVHRYPFTTRDLQYTVTLTATDDAGNEDVSSQVITILGPPAALLEANRVWEDGSNAVWENGDNRVWEDLVSSPGPLPGTNQLYFWTLTGGQMESMTGAEMELLKGELV